MVALDSLRPHPRNSNRHPPEQVELFARILRAHGWRRAVTVSKLSGFVTRGHGAMEAARLAGIKTVPVDDQAYASEAEEVADLQADNQLARLSREEPAVLRDALAYLGGARVDLSLAGFGADALAGIGLDERGLRIKVAPAEPLGKAASKVVHKCPKCGHRFSAD